MAGGRHEWPFCVPATESGDWGLPDNFEGLFFLMNKRMVAFHYCSGTFPYTCSTWRTRRRRRKSQRSLSLRMTAAQSQPSDGWTPSPLTVSREMRGAWHSDGPPFLLPPPRYHSPEVAGPGQTRGAAADGGDHNPHALSIPLRLFPPVGQGRGGKGGGEEGRDAQCVLGSLLRSTDQYIPLSLR